MFTPAFQHRVLKVLGAAVMALILIACGSPAGQTGRTAAKPLRILNSFALTALDPAIGANWLVQFGSGEALTWADDNSEIQPWLLQSFQRVDPLTWRLQLRENVTFQNSKALNAQLAVAALQRQVEKNASAKELLGTATFDASGLYEITLRTSTPDAFVPGKLAEYTAFPIYDVDTVVANPDGQALLGKGFYTGPYAATAFAQDQLELTRYDGYWGGRPALPGVSLKIVADTQARLAAVRSGEADLSLYPAIETKAVLRGQKDAYFITAKSGKESLQLVMNQHVAPFSEYPVRRALSLAIDYASLAQNVLDGVYDTAQGLYPMSTPGAVANQTTDLGWARQLLDQAGWTPGADGVRTKNGQRLEITLLTYPQQPDTATAAVAIQSQLKPAGFAVNILSTDDINASMARPNSSWQAALVFNGTISGASGIPNLALSRYLGTGSASNASGVSDSQLDQLIAQLNQTFDAELQQQLLKQIQQLVVVDNAYLIIAAYKAFPMITGPDWNGFSPALYRRWVQYDTAPGRAR